MAWMSDVRRGIRMGSDLVLVGAVVSALIDWYGHDGWLRMVRLPFALVVAWAAGRAGERLGLTSSAWAEWVYRAGVGVWLWLRGGRWIVIRMGGPVDRAFLCGTSENALGWWGPHERVRRFRDQAKAGQLAEVMRGRVVEVPR